MEKKRSCGKCNSADFAAVRHRTNSQGDDGIGIPLGPYAVARPTLYVCCACGFSEMWIDGERDLQDIRSKYSQS